MESLGWNNNVADPFLRQVHIGHKKGLAGLLMYIHQKAVKEGESSFSG